jgi:hypothetical protein
MSARPIFSPAMLAFFLRARAVLAHAERPARCGMQATVKRERARWKRLSGLTHAEIEFAWMGRLNNGAKRARLWAVLGHFPADFGIVLTDDGGQQ